MAPPLPPPPPRGCRRAVLLALAFAALLPPTHGLRIRAVNSCGAPADVLVQFPVFVNDPFCEGLLALDAKADPWCVLETTVAAGDTFEAVHDTAAIAAADNCIWFNGKWTEGKRLGNDGSCTSDAECISDLSANQCADPRDSGCYRWDVRCAGTVKGNGGEVEWSVPCAGAPPPAAAAAPQSAPASAPAPPAPPASPAAVAVSGEPAAPGADESTGSSFPVGAVVGAVLGVAVVAAVAGLLYWRHAAAKKKTSATIVPGRPARSAGKAPPAGLGAPPAAALLDGDPVLSWIASAATASSASLPSAPSSSSSKLSAQMRAWEFSWADVRAEGVLGLGSFGKVFLARLNEATVAVKVLIDARAATAGGGGAAAARRRGASSAATSAPPVAAAAADMLIEEAALLASLRHPNIVGFMGFCVAPPAIATEYCARGSLYDLLKAAAADDGSAEARELTWARRAALARDAAAGMLHLHTRRPAIVHRDLKSPNLLVTGDWCAKVADVGLSRIVEDAAVTGRAHSATEINPRWLAPELFEGAPASPATDVYSFGLILWELLTWELPWASVHTFAVRHWNFLSFFWLSNLICQTRRILILSSYSPPADLRPGARGRAAASAGRGGGARPGRPRARRAAALPGAHAALLGGRPSRAAGLPGDCRRAARGGRRVRALLNIARAAGTTVTRVLSYIDIGLRSLEKECENRSLVLKCAP
jgi:serine/threonine protein kinase